MVRRNQWQNDRLDVDSCFVVKFLKLKKFFKQSVHRSCGKSNNINKSSQIINFGHLKKSTQPLGTPEINKKSLTSCQINGGEELFIIGKNFLKDTKVMFRNEKWLKVVEPNREYLKSVIYCFIVLISLTKYTFLNSRHI